MKRKESLILLFLGTAIVYVLTLLLKELDLYAIVSCIFDLISTAGIALCFVFVFEPLIEKLPFSHRTFCCTIVYLSLFVLVIMIGGLLAPVIINEWDKIKELFQMMNSASDSQIELAFSYDSAVSSTLQLVSQAADLLIAYLMAYFISVEFEELRSFLITWKDFKSFFDEYEQFKEIIFQYLKALLVDMSVLFTALLIVLSCFDVSYALSLSLCLALLNIIPYFGALAGQILIFVVDFLVFGRFRFLMILSVFAIQQIESNVLQPMLVGKMMNIRPLYMFVSILFFGRLIGFTGVLFAPVFAVAVQYIVQKQHFSSMKRERLE